MVEAASLREFGTVQFREALTLASVFRLDLQTLYIHPDFHLFLLLCLSLVQKSSAQISRENPANLGCVVQRDHTGNVEVRSFLICTNPRSGPVQWSL